jgi:hypothetical protein
MADYQVLEDPSKRINVGILVWLPKDQFAGQPLAMGGRLSASVCSSEAAEFSSPAVRRVGRKAAPSAERTCLERPQVVGDWN